MKKACMWGSQILLIIGAINWGLVGIGGFAQSNFNVVNLLFSSAPTVEWIVYILVGVAGLASLAGMFMCKGCSK